ncbi:MAG: aromatic ring-hydroxylating dioxygenase subunit alpha, partial [Dehalococcoidia bacterium]
HGWKFDVDGNCVDMPNEPAQSNFAGKVKAKSYPAAEWGGLIWIYMGPKDKQPELPQYDWCLAPSPDQQVWKWMQESNYAQGLEGNIDSSHVSFLHRWFGKMPDYLESGAPALMAKETDFGFIYGARRPSDDELFHWRVTAFVLPVYTVIPNRSGKGAGFFVVPMDDEHSWWFTIQRAAPLDLGPARDAYVDLIPGTFRQTRNKDNDYLLDREMQRTQNYSGLPTNRVQDCAVTESMGPVVDRTRERLGTSDVAIIFMRRLLIRLARELQEGREPALLKHAEWHNILPLDVDDPQPDLATLWDAHSSELVVPTVKA